MDVDENDDLHINGIMPIHEWCDEDSGCAFPGVDDDPQMNAASIVACKFAIEAAELLGEEVNQKWR